MGMIKEFKEFAMRGNVVDMAVGIIIGAAFGKIVSSLVKDIIMPPLGMITGKIDFSNLAIELSAAEGESAAVMFRYGAFIQSIFDFAIVAFAVFLLVKQMNRLQREQPTAAPTTRECPRCVSQISLKATRCPHCTSELAHAA